MKSRGNRTKRGLQMNAMRRKLLANLAKGMNITEAARLAGYSSAETSDKAVRKMRLYMAEAMAALGMPVDKWLKALIDKAHARETKFFDSSGVVIETREVEAHDIQLRALIEIGKIFNAYPRNEHETDDGSDRPAGPTYNLVIADPRVAEAVLEKLARSGRYSGQPVLDAECDSHEDDPAE